MISLVIIHGTTTFDLENGIRNFAVCVAVKKDHQTVIIKSYPVPQSAGNKIEFWHDFKVIIHDVR